VTGILVQSSSGLIFAEACDAYPNGWTFGQSGTGTASAGSTTPAHAGAAAFKIATGKTWPANAYGKLTKILNLQTGANRTLRAFRGALSTSAWPAPTRYDDFPGSTIDTGKWTIGGDPSQITVSNSQAHLPANYNQLSSNALTLVLPMKIGARFAVPYQPYVAITAKFRVLKGWIDSAVEINVNYQNNDTHAWAFFLGVFSNGSTDQVDLGATDTNMHLWEVDVRSGYTDIYKDGTLVCHHVVSISNLTSFYAYLEGQCDVDYVDTLDYTPNAAIVANAYKHSLIIGAQTFYDIDENSDAGTLDNGFHDSGWIAVTATGSLTAEIKLRNASATGYIVGPGREHSFDDLICMLDKTFTINGLLGGQKVEVYNAGGGLLKSALCPAPGSPAVITGLDAYISTANGLLCYMKIYDTDATTLLYTTSTTWRWGGDVYLWIPQQSDMSISTSVAQVYRTGSGLTPLTTTITATLMDDSTGLPVSGKTITFTPNLGSCSPTSGTTGADGKVITTYTSGSAAGLGGVLAAFAGDSTYGSSLAQQLIDIYYAAKTIDSTKDFQAWIEGQEVVVASGSYMLSSDFIPQAFTLVSPILNVTLGGWWFIEIYRRGTLEFSGRILTRSRVGGPNPQLTITGLDEKLTLQRRVANRTYLDEPKNIINDLLVRYSCGISAGSISLYGSVISLPATYTNLFDALNQITTITGWKFHLNANRTLDFAPGFGGTPAINVQTPGNEATAQHKEDWTNIDTKVYAVGSSPGAQLVSSAVDLTAQQTYGLIEEAFLEKNLNAQGTLDLAAQTLLSTRKDVKETITVDWIDANPAGTYGPFDIITVTDGDLNLSGTYVVSTLTRDLADANKASLALTNRVLTIADALQQVRKNVQDMGVL